MTSPGVTSAPAHTTGMFTEPSVALTVPLTEIALLHTGKFISVSTRTSRTPRVDDERPRAARLEARREQVAEVAVGAFRRDRGDDDIAGPDLLGRDVQHPVVAGMQQHGDGRAADCAPA